MTSVSIIADVCVRATRDTHFRKRLEQVLHYDCWLSGLNPRRHPLMLLVVLVSTQCLLVFLSILILTPAVMSIEIVASARYTNPNSSPDATVLLNPPQATPGSVVKVTASGFSFSKIPSGDIKSISCSISSNPMSLFVSPPGCDRESGDITGRFQVSTTAKPGVYEIRVTVNWSAQVCVPVPPQAHTPMLYQTSSCTIELYPPELGSASLTVNEQAPATTTVWSTTYISNTKTVPTTATRFTTEEICSQLPVTEAIVTASAAAAAAAVATHIYAKQRPGFDVEVRSGIDREESSG